VSRVRENRMPGSMRRREEPGTNGHSAPTVLAPPADPTLTPSADVFTLGLEAVLQRGDARVIDSPNVASLPRSLNGARVVVLTNPGNRVLGCYAGKLRDAGQRRSGASSAAATGNFYAEASGCEAMRLLEGRPRVVSVNG
jgi:hypothetical protein